MTEAVKGLSQADAALFERAVPGNTSHINFMDIRMGHDDLGRLLAAARAEELGKSGLTGKLVWQAFADTFNGGGWADAPGWDDYDKAGQDRFERAAARLSEILTSPAALPDDVVRLVIAAREVAFGDIVMPGDDQGRAWIKELDAASEAFADRVPWENEPDVAAPADGVADV